MSLLIFNNSTVNPALHEFLRITECIAKMFFFCKIELMEHKRKNETINLTEDGVENCPSKKRKKKFETVYRQTGQYYYYTVVRLFRSSPMQKQ